jgi:hypothetical protein
MKQKLIIMGRSIAMILLAFVAASIFDVILAAIGFFAYSNGAFITVFGVGGVFAGFLGYMAAMEKASKTGRIDSIGIIAMQVIIGLLFFFPIAAIEGGEYRVPFKAFGLMLALSSLFFLGKARDIVK